MSDETSVRRFKAATEVKGINQHQRVTLVTEECVLASDHDRIVANLQEQVEKVESDYSKIVSETRRLACDKFDEYKETIAELQAQVDALTWQRNQMTAAFYAGCLPSRNDLTPHKIKELDAEIEAIARGEK